MSNARRRERLVAVIPPLVFLVLFFGAAWGRELALGGRAVAACESALSRGDAATAIAEARAAAEAEAPFSPYPARGYAKLGAIAADAEARGDERTAAAAWRATRSAALATRTAAPALARANAELSRLGARAAAKDPGGDAPSAAIEARITSDLSEDPAPMTLSFVLLGAGGALFFAGLALLISRPAALGWRALRWPSVAITIGVVLAALACAQR